MLYCQSFYANDGCIHEYPKKRKFVEKNIYDNIDIQTTNHNPELHRVDSYNDLLKLLDENNKLLTLKQFEIEDDNLEQLEMEEDDISN